MKNTNAGPLKSPTKTEDERQRSTLLGDRSGSDRLSGARMRSRSLVCQLIHFSRGEITLSFPASKEQ